MRDDREKLKDILEAIIKIEKYLPLEREYFDKNELIQTYFLYNLQIIGEAARSFSKSFREVYPDIPWSQIIGMRNILVHNYFEIDLDVVWYAVINNLPSLKAQIIAILEENKSEPQ